MEILLFGATGMVGSGRVHVSPGFIRPVKGAPSKVGWIYTMYVILSPLTALVAALLPERVVTTATLGRAMLHVGMAGYPKRVEPPDIAEPVASQPDYGMATRTSVPA
jgi:hypothetical protein